jgi:hypothetical protein
MQGAVHRLHGAILDADFGQRALDHIHCAEAWHFGGDEGGGELARMNAPVAVGEVFEKELIQRVAVKHDQRFFRVFWGPGH